MVGNCADSESGSDGGDAANVPTYAGDTASSSMKRYSARTEMYRKFKKGKDISNYSASQLKEILGKRDDDDAPASSGCTISYATPAAATTTPTTSEYKSDVNTHTSSLSIQDYFKAKMSAASTGKPASKFQVASGAGFSEDFQEDYYHKMQMMAHTGRGGLGLGSGSASSSGFTMSGLAGIVFFLFSNVRVGTSSERFVPCL